MYDRQCNHLRATQSKGPSWGRGSTRRHSLGPATSQVVDLVVALLFLFPEGEVLLEELDNALGIAEVVLLKLIDLVEGLLKSVISELTCFRMVLEHFVVEHGEIESEAKLNGVAGGKIDRVSLLISLLGLLLDLFEEVFLGVLGNVAIVVAYHLDEESLGLFRAVSVEDTVVDHVDDLLAVSGELSLDLALVSKECRVELGVLGVLLDGGDGAACGAFAADQVFEGNGEEVALVGVHRASLDDEDFFKEVHHVFEAFSLLSDSGKENLLFDGVGGGHLGFRGRLFLYGNEKI